MHDLFFVQQNIGLIGKRRGRRTRGDSGSSSDSPTDKIHPMPKKKISKATLVARGLFPSMIEEAFPIRLLVGFARRVNKWCQRPGRRRFVICCDRIDNDLDDRLCSRWKGWVNEVERNATYKYRDVRHVINPPAKATPLA
jgi:hypothetical protein